MTPKECIDLVTPEADRQPRARRSALPSHAAVAATLSFGLTADTPPPISAQGIADVDNDRRGGDGRNDSDRPPDLPHLHETSVYPRSNTSHALTSVTAPVTNSSSSPRRKKSRSLQPRYSGKENSSNGTLVEKRKSPPILAGTNQFRGPREIPCFLNGVFVGQFLPQVQIPANHPRGEIIRLAAATLRTLPAYLTRSDYIEHRIFTLVTMDVSNVTHHTEAVAKCPTIRLGVSDECFTYCNAGADMNKCPSF